MDVTSDNTTPVAAAAAATIAAADGSDFEASSSDYEGQSDLEEDNSNDNSSFNENDESKMSAIDVGFRICKFFVNDNGDGFYYTGIVVDLETARRVADANPKSEPFPYTTLPYFVDGEHGRHWRVHYDFDLDTEDISEEELYKLQIAPDSAQPKECKDPPIYVNNPIKRKDKTKRTDTSAKKYKKSSSQHSEADKSEPPSQDIQEACTDLCYNPFITKEMAMAVLQIMKPPYDLNEAMKLIHENKNYDSNNNGNRFASGKFNPVKGMPVRKVFETVNAGRQQFYGKVVSNQQKWDSDTREYKWKVRWSDDEIFWYTHSELYRIRADRPTKPVGRQFCILELFCGTATVSCAFLDRKWEVCSIDIEKESNATVVADVMNLRFDNIGFVPDFIWISIPCLTYSNLAKSIHRPNDKPISEEAHKADRLLVKVMAILQILQKKNPNLVYVIENPKAELEKTELMRDFMDRYSLTAAEVHYCQFGRDDKKPTVLITNNHVLACRLNMYRCTRRSCPYYTQNHPDGARCKSSGIDYAAIPTLLAELVARLVDAYFCWHFSLEHVPKTRLAMTSEEIATFDNLCKVPPAQIDEQEGAVSELSMEEPAQHLMDEQVNEMVQENEAVSELSTDEQLNNSNSELQEIEQKLHLVQSQVASLVTQKLGMLINKIEIEQSMENKIAALASEICVLHARKQTLMHPM